MRPVGSWGAGDIRSQRQNQRLRFKDRLRDEQKQSVTKRNKETEINIKKMAPGHVKQRNRKLNIGRKRWNDRDRITERQ